ncbi:signal peptidase I [Chloroflexota bacterium]
MSKSSQQPENFKKLVEDIFEDVIDLSNRPQLEKQADPLIDHTAELFDELMAMKERLEESSLILQAREEESPFIYHQLEAQQKKVIPESRLNFREFAVLALVSVTIFIIANIIFFRTKVVGPSMEPGISHNDIVMVNKLAYRNNDIQSGDVIVFRNPEFPDQITVKRVIGVPGDEIEIVEGWIWINGVLLDEPYLGTPDPFDYPTTTIKEGMIFVLGDNRTVSEDSRAWGTLFSEEVIGRADFIYWPLPSFGIVYHYHTSIFDLLEN